MIIKKCWTRTYRLDVRYITLKINLLFIMLVLCGLNYSTNMHLTNSTKSLCELKTKIKFLTFPEINYLSNSELWENHTTNPKNSNNNPSTTTHTQLPDNQPKHRRLKAMTWQLLDLPTESKFIPTKCFLIYIHYYLFIPSC